MLGLRRGQPLLQLPRLLRMLGLRIDRIGQAIEYALHAIGAGWQLSNPPRDARLLRNSGELPGTGWGHRRFPTLKQLQAYGTVVIGLCRRGRDMILIDQVNQELQCLHRRWLIELEVLAERLVQEGATVHSDEVPIAFLVVVL